MRSSIIAAALGATLAQAQIQGFNYGSTNTDGSIKDQATFTAEFNAAKGLVGTTGFTSARLYTMIQGGTENTPISAIPAAIASKTTLLLGLWASGGQAGMNAEIAALKSAISQYGTAFTSLVTGISVGSEDLYRISPTGIAANSGYGADPAVVASYITQVRAAIQGTALSGAGIGHVDTWTAWVNGSNSAVINAVDWVGMDAYPYFQSTQANGIENGKALFDDAVSVTKAAVGGKPVWVTETGWPVSGAVSGAAVANLANAKTYWQQVGCPLFGSSTPTYWFTLQDAFPVTPNPSFGIVGSTLSTTPLFDLSCSSVSSSSSSSSSASSSTSASVGSSTSGSASASNTASILSSGSSAAGAQTGAQAPTAGNGVGGSSVRAPVTASSNGTAQITTAAGGSATTIATSTSARSSSSAAGAAAGTGAAGAGSGASSTSSARTSTFTGAAVTGAGSIIAAAGAFAAAIYAL